MTLPTAFAAAIHHLIGGASPLLVPLKICPKAPAGAQQYVDDLSGYVLFGVLAIFGIAGAVCIGAIVLGRVLRMQHISQGGVVGLFVVLICAVVYVLFPDVVNDFLGTGCI
ncbi:MAG: hypothetical protein LCH76_14000 [Actinobacteria bacterium]|nr:hypothetical protein [Actinomycetota bacterium]